MTHIDATHPNAEIAMQAGYHRDLFGGLYRWDAICALANEMMGGVQMAALMGLDQLGHFGPHGVRLVAQRMRAAADGPLSRVIELGSGFGGAIRHLGRELKELGQHPELIGVEFVEDHVRLALEIGRSLEATGVRFVVADVAAMPFASNCADAMFATGSASHFAAMDAVLAECARILRPGGVLVMTEEVSLRPEGAPEPSEGFLEHHAFARMVPLDGRRAQLERAGLAVETYEPLTAWAVSLLKQRVQGMKFLKHCGEEMFGSERYPRIMATVTSTAEEYSRGSLQPALFVARRPR